MRKRKLVFFLFLFFFSTLLAQKNFSLTEYEIRLTGTSNLFNWWAVMHEASLKEQAQTLNLKNIGICVLVNSNELSTSGGFIMNHMMRKTLDTKTYPEILFRIQNFESIDKLDKERYKVNASGSLTVKEISRQLKFDLTAQEKTKNEWIFSEIIPLKMSDFNMNAPVLFNGNLRTDDKINLHFKFSLKAKNAVIFENFDTLLGNLPLKN